MIQIQNNLTLHEARKARKKFHPILQILIFVLLFTLLQLITGMVAGGLLVLYLFLIRPEMLGDLISSGDPMAMVNQLTSAEGIFSGGFGTFIMLIATIFPLLGAVAYCRWIEKRSLLSMGFTRGRTLSKYLAGYGVGVLMIVAAYLIALAFGSVRFEGLAAQIPWLMLFLLFVGFLIQGMSEEVMVRGYLMVSLANRVSITAAVLISSMIFAAMHLFNSGITVLSVVNLFLFGIFAAVIFLRTDNIWLIAGFHSAWNFVQGNVLGVLVSGLNTNVSLFNSSVVPGKEIISGGSFGLEGGLVTTFVYLIGIVLVLFLRSRRVQKLSRRRRL